LKARADTICMPIDDLPEASLIKRFLTLLVKREKSNYPKKWGQDYRYEDIQIMDKYILS